MRAFYTSDEVTGDEIMGLHKPRGLRERPFKSRYDHNLDAELPQWLSTR
jgi:hypothetical protein